MRSYPLEIFSLRESTQEENQVAYDHPARVKTCAMAADNISLAVAFEGGLVQVHNIFTGAIVFNRHNWEGRLIVDAEVSRLHFFISKTNFWFVAACERGRVAFFSAPIVKMGQNFLQCRRAVGKHARDV